jgi:hypothetical protein
MDGLDEIHVIHRGCHYGAPRVLDRRDRTSQIHQVHDLATQKIAESIGVIGQREF